MDRLGTNKKGPRTLAREEHAESVVQARHRFDIDGRDPENDGRRVGQHRSV